MKIGIDGLTLSIKHPCGVKIYSEELLNALMRIDETNEYIIFSRNKIRIPNQKNFKLFMIPQKLPFYNRQFFMTYYAQKEHVDIFHHLDSFGTIFKSGLKTITTVHDVDLSKIYPKTLGELYNRLLVEILRFFTLRKTDHFISVSNYTSKQLLNKLRMKKKKISTIYEAFNNKFRILNKHTRKDSNYFLCLSDFSPKKNTFRIIKAFSLLSEDIRNKYILKIVISTKIPKQKLANFARELKLLSKIRFIHRPDLDGLVTCYNNATVFLYPSLYEGFGLPILEAMACGCPVITSKISATKEVSGGAAYLVNPKSVVDISKAMNNMAVSTVLRKKYINSGLKRVKEFSWDETARKTLKVYEKVYNSM